MPLVITTITITTTSIIITTTGNRLVAPWEGHLQGGAPGADYCFYVVRDFRYKTYGLLENP